MSGELPPFDWFSFVKEGGAYTSPLLLGALIWMNRERVRLLNVIDTKDRRFEELNKEAVTAVNNSNATATTVKDLVSSITTLLTSTTARK